MENRLTVFGMLLSITSFAWMLITALTLQPALGPISTNGVALSALAFAYLAMAVLLFLEFRLGFLVVSILSITTAVLWLYESFAAGGMGFYPLFGLQALLFAVAAYGFVRAGRQKGDRGRTPLDLPVFG